MNDKNKSGIIYTLAAKCRDCYRCLRECPVKAIGIKDGQAFVDANRCIMCGKCIKECPQGAKTYRNDVETVKYLIDKGKPLVASVAPSFASVYDGWKAKRLASALRKLGFRNVVNTNEAANLVAKESLKYIKNNNCTGSICSACPVVVNYIEKYAPEHKEKLIPIMSPMVAHGKMLKSTYGDDVNVVFIGPCIAKKYEAQKEEYKDLVNVVLTFEELDGWIEKEKIDLSICEESDFDTICKSSCAGLFPIPGGFLKTAGLSNETTMENVLHTSGYRNNIELFGMGRLKFDIIEALFCDEGCINGPGISRDINLFERKSNLLGFYNNYKVTVPFKDIEDIDLSIKKYGKYEKLFNDSVKEEEIARVLALTGKDDPKNRLNCGACGYKSCKDKARAVVLKMAEAQMCIPYMRRLAEQKTDVIIDTVPAGIILIDENQKILSMNNSFRKYFYCSDETLGRRVSYLFDSEGYEKVMANVFDNYKSIIKYNGIEYHQEIYAIREQKQYVGIYTKINKDSYNEAKMYQLKETVVDKVLELKEQQINMAHQLATLLGENSAKVEEIIWRLMNVYEE